MKEMNQGQKSYEFKEIIHGSVAYEAALALRNKELREPLGMDIRNDDLSGEAQQKHFGLFHEEQLIGILVLQAIDGETYKMRQVAIDRDFQGQGLGRLLVESSERMAIELGAKRIMLHGRMTVSDFYQRLGYTPYGQPFIEIGLEHIKLEKNLSS